MSLQKKMLFVFSWFLCVWVHLKCIREGKNTEMCRQHDRTFLVWAHAFCRWFELEAYFSFADESKIACEVIIEHEPSPDLTIHATLRRNLFLIVKEAMNNSMRHADATKVTITIGVTDNKFMLEIKDNGKGFDVQNKTIYGNGLNNIEKRVKQINGTISIQSNINNGTVIKIKCVL